MASAGELAAGDDAHATFLRSYTPFFSGIFSCTIRKLQGVEETAACLPQGVFFDTLSQPAAHLIPWFNLRGWPPGASSCRFRCQGCNCTQRFLPRAYGEKSLERSRVGERECSFSIPTNSPSCESSKPTLLVPINDFEGAALAYPTGSVWRAWSVLAGASWVSLGAFGIYGGHPLSRPAVCP